MRKLIVIIGPTAAKKSLVATMLARAVHGQIVNGDAFQVYREINVGVNKPGPEVLREIPHHLINCCSYRDEWNLAKFQAAFDAVYQKISGVGDPVILCGGSHLYLDAILRGYDLTNREVDAFMPLFSAMDGPDLWEFIHRYDPLSAQKIGIHNRKRLVRAAAIIRANNYAPKSTLEVDRNVCTYDPLVIMVNQERAVLYAKIDARFEKMWAAGWEDEVRSLLDADPEIINSQAFRAIGYREIAHAILYRLPINRAEIQRKTRNLAKRQLTWCRNKFPTKITFDPTKDDFQALLKTVKDYLNDTSPLHPHSLL